VRAGYLRAPTFMYSDSVFIGYANTWVRPPLEVYNLSPVYQIRGVDATWRGTVGAFNVTVSPYIGDSEVDLPGQTLDVPRWSGISASIERGSFMLRVGYSQSEIGGAVDQLQPVIDALNGVPAAFCATCSSEADKLNLDGEKFDTLNVGVQYDDGKNFVASEYATFGGDESYVLTKKSGAYATYGRRFANVMPYATYAILRRGDVADATSVQIPGLTEGINALIAQGYNDQDSYGLGLRYEVPSFSVVKGAIVKLQYDRIEAQKGIGMFNAVTAGFDGDANMISASFDFIF
jgi:hypothetical protein